MHRDLVELLTSTQPDKLCLVFVQFQAITGHPVTDPRDARCQTIRRLGAANSWRADVDLCVVGVRVACETDPATTSNSSKTYSGNSSLVQTLVAHNRAAGALQTSCPCSTPAGAGLGGNDAIQSSADPEIPNLSRSRRNKMSWFTQSNAALRSSNPNSVTC